MLTLSLQTDGLHKLKLDDEEDLAAERTIYKAQRRLPNRGGLSLALTAVMKQVFSVRPPPTTYDEALPDKLVRLKCVEEMTSGQRTLLMKSASLYDNRRAGRRTAVWALEGKWSNSKFV